MTVYKKIQTLLALMILLIPFGGSVSAAGNKPAIEYASLLNIRFYEEKGGFRIDKLQLVFPPEDNQPISMVIVDEKNTVVASLKMRRENWSGNEAFDGLRAIGPGIVNIGKPGKYTMAFMIGKEFITTYQFTLHTDKSGDAFSSKNHFYRSGYWSNIAYLSTPVKKESAPLSFSWWSSSRDFQDDKKRATSTIHLMRSGKEVAAGRSSAVVSSNNWVAYTEELVQPGTGGKAFTIPMLTAKDGDYQMVIKIDDKAVKSYAIQVQSGEISRLKFNQLDYEPHTSFISPRMLDTSSRSGSYKMIDAFWVLKE